MKKVKVGQLALKAGVLPSTIRYYVQQGLLEVADKTLSGYQLFDEGQSLKIIEKIKHLQEKERKSISEIKNQLSKTI